MDNFLLGASNCYKNGVRALGRYLGSKSTCLLAVSATEDGPRTLHRVPINLGNLCLTTEYKDEEKRETEKRKEIDKGVIQTHAPVKQPGTLPAPCVLMSP